MLQHCQQKTNNWYFLIGKERNRDGSFDDNFGVVTAARMVHHWDGSLWWGRFALANQKNASQLIAPVQSSMVVKNDDRDWHLMAPVDTRWHSASIRNLWESGGYSVDYRHAMLLIRAHRGHQKESQMTRNESFGFFALPMWQGLRKSCRRLLPASWA